MMLELPAEAKCLLVSYSISRWGCSDAEVCPMALRLSGLPHCQHGGNARWRYLSGLP
ncbi:hypothetical protein KCP78_18380 [Salmonella enterica subsp. enterica]|nr:hypothetical protein KCP78_18380 [Salmonella enterica subsp. enterica]